MTLQSFVKSENFILLVFCFVPLIIESTLLHLLADNKEEQEWYEKLKPPPHDVPEWLDGIIWTYFYISLGYASFRIWHHGDRLSGPAKIPLAVYLIQLIISWAWTPLFFGFHLLLASAIDVFVLLIFAIITYALFYRVDRIASFFFIPYIIWLCFESYLSYMTYKLNMPPNFNDFNETF